MENKSEMYRLKYAENFVKNLKDGLIKPVIINDLRGLFVDTKDPILVGVELDPVNMQIYVYVFDSENIYCYALDKQESMPAFSMN
ncbi:MAG: hypothetical protein IRZ03_18710 [Acidobacterium ailaaui]|nr:hypothetical protein [Pseudacidobacterium ailaaui]